MIRATIKKEMESRGDNPSQLAKRIGVHHPSMYNYFNGKAGLRYDVLEKVMVDYDLIIVKKY
jgi:AcrR family transcriptional regulator